MEHSAPRDNPNYPRALTSTEFLRLPLEIDPVYAATPWEFDAEALSLVLHEDTTGGRKARIYEVDLERCSSAQEVLDWIFHITKKRWATDTVVAGLVRDLSLYLDTIALSHGTDGGSINVCEVVAKQMERAKVVRGRAVSQDEPTDV